MARGSRAWYPQKAGLDALWVPVLPQAQKPTAQAFQEAPENEGVATSSRAEAPAEASQRPSHRLPSRHLMNQGQGCTWKLRQPTGSNPGAQAFPQYPTPLRRSWPPAPRLGRAQPLQSVGLGFPKPGLHSKGAQGSPPQRWPQPRTKPAPYHPSAASCLGTVELQGRRGRRMGGEVEKETNSRKQTELVKLSKTGEGEGQPGEE